MKMDGFFYAIFFDISAYFILPMKILSVVTFILVSILFAYTAYKNSTLTSTVQKLETTLLELQINSPEENDNEFDLAAAMGKLQYFSNKLYYSLQSQNKALSDFYTHEIEETLEAIEKNKVVDDGIDISANIKTYGLKGLENFEKFMEQNPKDFENNYQGLINTCNACHMVSKHPFINIITPTAPAVSNQSFEWRTYTTQLLFRNSWMQP